MKLFYVYFILLYSIFSIELKPQDIDPETIGIFRGMTEDTVNLSSFIDPAELKLTKRLGIYYKDKSEKFFMDFGIKKSVLNDIKEKRLSYNLTEENLGSSFSKIIFEAPEAGYKKNFFLKNKKLISPASYFTRNWQIITTKHFKIYLSDPKLFNSYSADQLENHISGMFDLLKIPEERGRVIEENKILYFLCKDKDEIRKIIEVDTNNYFLKSIDAIITTDNCDFHELSHLLLNFKLEKNFSNTISFLREGFATAAGGWDRNSKNVCVNNGFYFQKFNIVPFNSILLEKDFYDKAPEYSYPAAGFYSTYLLEEYGINIFLKIYQSHSGREEDVLSFGYNDIKLPSPDEFTSYVGTFKPRGGILLEKPDMPFEPIHIGENFRIESSEHFYSISIKGKLLLSLPSSSIEIGSRKFRELFSQTDYKGQKYFISADPRKINIFNLFNGHLIASLDAGIMLDIQGIQPRDNFYSFFVDRKFFDEDLRYLIPEVN